MNDDELSLRLRDELHERIRPPDTAPEAVHEHLRRLRTMEVVRPSERVRASRGFRQLSALAAVLAVGALVGAGLLIRASQSPDAAGPFASGIEAFGRIDANTAWAAAGSQLFMTRDGGKTWSTGTIPGGRSLAQMEAASPEPTIPTDPTPCVPQNSAEAANGCSSGPSVAQFDFNRLYPDFIDADHGWLVSWTISGTTMDKAEYSMTIWRTSDGGHNWTSAALPGTYKGPALVQFVDASHGWITIMRSYATVTSPGSGSLAEPTAAPAMASDATVILASSDGGATWTTASTLSEVAMPRFVSTTEAWGYGQTVWGEAPTDIVHSTDAGRTWTTATMPLPDGYGVLRLPDAPVLSGGTLTASVPVYSTSGAGSPPAVASLSSTDGGRTWRLESTRPVPSEDPNSIGFLTPQTGLYGAPSGQPLAVQSISADKVEFTFDGGASWDAFSIVGLPGRVAAAQWTSAGDIWVIASDASSPTTTQGGLYATADKGKTWQPLLGAATWPASMAPSTPNPFASVEAVPSEVVPTPEQSAGAHASASASPSGGPSASPGSSAAGSPAIPGPSLGGMGRVDDKTGWVLFMDPYGGQVVRITSDGGATWSETRRLPAPTPEQLQFADAIHGWETESKAPPTDGVPDLTVVVWRTADGGRSWQSSTVPVGRPTAAQGSLFQETTLHFRDQRNGVLIAEYGWADLMGKPNVSPTPSEAICEAFETSDGGATWSQPVAAPCLTHATFDDAAFGYANDILGRPALYVTFDGGRTWTSGPLPSGLSSSGSFGLRVVRENPDGTLTAIGDWLGESGGQAVSLLASTDRGKTWKLSGTPKGLSVQAHLVSAGGVLLAIEPAASGALAESKVLVSRDGGLSWQPWSNGLPFGPAGLEFISDSDGWALMLGADRSVYATSDGGATWKVILTP